MAIEPVVKALGFMMQFFCSEHNPADATTYRIGAIPAAPATTGLGPYRLYVPRDGSIRWVAFSARTSGTLGSSETGSVYVRVNGVTDYLVSDALTWDIATKVVGGDIVPDDIPLIKEDFLELAIVTPTWVTNPTVVIYSAQVWIEA